MRQERTAPLAGPCHRQQVESAVRRRVESKPAGTPSRAEPRDMGKSLPLGFAEIVDQRSRSIETHPQTLTSETLE